MVEKLRSWEIIMHWHEKVYFRPITEKKSDYIKRGFEQKLQGIQFPTKNSVNAFLYLTQERSYEAPKICVITHLLRKYTLGLTLGKIQIISKNASNKSFTGLNFLQKFQWTHISIYCRSGARVLQRFTFLRNCDTLTWESTLFGRMLRKIPIISESAPNKCWEIKFPLKN